MVRLAKICNVNDREDDSAFVMGDSAFVMGDGAQDCAWLRVVGTSRAGPLPVRGATWCAPLAGETRPVLSADAPEHLTEYIQNRTPRLARSSLEWPGEAAPGASPPTPGARSAHEARPEDWGGVTSVASGGAADQDGVDLADGLGVHGRTRCPAGVAQGCPPRHPARRAAPQLVHVQPLALAAVISKARVSPVDIRRDRDSEGRATPLPSRDPRHRAPAVARPPDRANPATARPLS